MAPLLDLPIRVKCGWDACQKMIEQHHGRGRPKEYCSPRCCQRAWRARLREESARLTTNGGKSANLIR